ncbi:hypothetical protein GQ43DRAFT_468290 [Delitschia confertaspora ATCC 74209]|uniref:Protein artemis n=1 Tax=Delitschia confertaspora ATCC 74209 TaxID=1513339 RepID=A0A9P4JUC6_9PLEO|nr:hypothetical protein GQ43DRAFT_468290 [Delitschia confertaspora ATCC 74209]
MSTFKGFVAEFPQIRIDYFRTIPGQPAPFACFLSHVHSDHLTGLESLRSPFVYCSPATREILLRLEKYHCRLNFARGILERRTVTYDTKKRIIKALPLDTPTTIELSPGNKIHVTLLDANHCVGAVMFLIEGNGKSVLYTGDIRAELWWVNSIVQNPVLLPYTLPSKRLDCVYLDTTFATKSQPYREFPSKAEGIRDLLENVSRYPKDTVFYFHSWTYGYENVWITLSSFLDSQIHLDPYRFRIYSSLSQLINKSSQDSLSLGVRESAALCGFQNGNHFHPGILTPSPHLPNGGASSQKPVRLHSCEQGMGCPVMEQRKDAVHIIPIVNRVNGTEIAELGAGGGKGDLDQTDELETADPETVGKLMQLCSAKINDQQSLSRVLTLLSETLREGKDRVTLGTELSGESQLQEGNMPVQHLVDVLTSTVARGDEASSTQPRVIKFPYSRHSSYSELCTLIGALQPRDVFPCTVDEEKWTPTLSMRNLFGQFCSDDVFRHDAEMMQMYEDRVARAHRGKRDRDDSLGEESQRDTQRTRTDDETAESAASPEPATPVRNKGLTIPEKTTNAISSPNSYPKQYFTPIVKNFANAQAFVRTNRNQGVVAPNSSTSAALPSASVQPPRPSPPPPPPPPQPSAFSTSHLPAPPSTFHLTTTPRHHPQPFSTTILPTLPQPTPSIIKPKPMTELRMTAKGIAYYAALDMYGMTWADIGGLVCTGNNHSSEELEL